MNFIRHSTNFQKVNIRFMMAVRRPVCPDRITRLPLDRFKTKLILGTFTNLWKKFKLVHKMTRIVGILYNDKCMFITTRRIILKK